MSEIVLIRVSAHDRPGITAELTGVLTRFDVRVLDIGQAVIHDDLAWGMLVEVPDDSTNSGLFKELLFKAYEHDLTLRIRPVSQERYQGWVEQQNRPKHIITLLGRTVQAAHIERIAALIGDNRLNIDRIHRLSGRARLDTPPEKRHAAIEFQVSGEVSDLKSMHGAFLQLGHEMEIDVAIQEDNIYRRNRRLVCFDMDSTLIQNEVMDELARVAGVGDKVSAITESAMRGELDFRESFTRRLSLLQGLDASRLEAVAECLAITEGAERLIATLKKYGYKIAILSGGFTYFAERLRQQLNLDYVYANELEIVDGKLTGRITGELVGEKRKAELLRKIAGKEHIHLEQVIAVGDGANDIPMLSIAGLGIAFHAKPVVRERARYAIGTLGLDAILYLLGMRERDFAGG